MTDWYYCSHSFRILYYAHIAGQAEKLLPSSSAHLSQKSNTDEQVAFVVKPASAVENNEPSLDEALASEEKLNSSTLLWSTQQKDYECRGDCLQHWPLYFYVAAVSRVTAKASDAPNIFPFTAAHPCCRIWKQAVRTKKAWHIPELVGPAIPNAAKDTEKRAMLLLLLFKPWDPDINSLLLRSDGTAFNTWFEAFTSFETLLKDAVQNRPTSIRPAMFSLAYWSVRTLAVIQNLDNLSQPKLLVNQRGVRTNPDAANGDKDAKTLPTHFSSDVINENLSEGESSASSFQDSPSEDDGFQDVDVVCMQHFEDADRVRYMYGCLIRFFT